jgi:hypothetical protein
LVENGVLDYNWSKFSQDFEMALVEACISLISMCNDMKPKMLINVISAFFEEKADEVIKMFEKVGILTKGLLRLTSLYVKDKDTFLIPK